MSALLCREEPRALVAGGGGRALPPLPTHLALSGPRRNRAAGPARRSSPLPFQPWIRPFASTAPQGCLYCKLPQPAAASLRAGLAGAGPLLSWVEDVSVPGRDSQCRTERSMPHFTYLQLSFDVFTSRDWPRLSLEFARETLCSRCFAGLAQGTGSGGGARSPNCGFRAPLPPCARTPRGTSLACTHARFVIATCSPADVVHSLLNFRIRGDWGPCPSAGQVIGMSGQSQTFNVRAAGSDYAFLQYFMGRFPSDVPDLGPGGSGGPWRLDAEDEEPAQPSSSFPSRGPK